MSDHGGHAPSGGSKPSSGGAKKGRFFSPRAISEHMAGEVAGKGGLDALGEGRQVLSDIFFGGGGEVHH